MIGSLGVFAAVLLSASATGGAPRRVAVLDFSARWSAGCATARTDAEQERCDSLRLFADQARAGALAVLRPPEYVVMTRENTAQMLKDMGGVCTEGECEVETARLIGATVVVSGDVSLMEGTYVVSLKVHDVASAALLGTGYTDARSKLEAVRNIRSETERMLKTASFGAPAPATAALPTPVPPPPPPPKKAEQGGEVVAREEAPTSVRSSPLAKAAPSAVIGRSRGPWYMEVRGGAIVSRGGLPTTLGSGTDAGRQEGQGIVLRLRAGYSFTPVWAVEASASLGEPGVWDSERHATYGAGYGAAFHSSYEPAFMGGVGGVWTPGGNRYLSMGLDAGIVLARAKVQGFSGWSGTGTPVEESREESGASPYLEADARLDYAFARSWSVGLRAGVFALFNQLAVSAGNSNFVLSYGANGAAAIQQGMILGFPIALSLGYRF